MKKITLTLAALGMLVFGKAQDGNNNCVYSALSIYNEGGGPKDLEDAIKCSDEASANDVTAVKGKTWVYRGELYTLIYRNETLKGKYPNAGLEAVKAFKKAYDLNDPKFKDWQDTYTYLSLLSTDMYNGGVEMYNAKNYAMAYQFFYSIKDLNAVIAGKGMKTIVNLNQALKNAASMAEASNNNEAVVNVYKDLIATSPDADAYRGLGIALKNQGKKEEAQKAIEEGMAKFPKDANLVIERLNFFLDEQNYVDALTYLNNLLSMDPNNGQALFIKGLAYENEKIRNEDSCLYYYNKSIEANAGKKPDPEFAKPYNNIGALYVKRANDLNAEMDKLGNSSADQKKYNELKQKQKDLFLQAKPFFVKANELNPGDPLIQRNLKTIELKTAE